jgi:hypothetical protein
MLFTLINEYNEYILEAWTNILHVILWLRYMELLPSSLLEMEDFRDSIGQPLESVRKIVIKDKKKNETTGITSYISWGLTNLLRTTDDEKLQRNEIDQKNEEEEWCKKGKTNISTCNISDIFNNSKYLNVSTLHYLIRSLILVSSYGTKPSTSLEIFSSTILNEDAAIFCLERLSDVIEKNANRLEDSDLQLWNLLFNHLENAIKNAPSEPTFYIGKKKNNILNK